MTFAARCLLVLTLLVPLHGRETQVSRTWIAGQEAGTSVDTQSSDAGGLLMETRETTHLERMGVVIHMDLLEQDRKRPDGSMTFKWTLSMSQEPQEGQGSWSPREPGLLRLTFKDGPARTLDIPPGALVWPGDLEDRPARRGPGGAAGAPAPLRLPHPAVGRGGPEAGGARAPAGLPGHRALQGPLRGGQHGGERGPVDLPHPGGSEARGVPGGGPGALPAGGAAAALRPGARRGPVPAHPQDPAAQPLPALAAGIAGALDRAGRRGPARGSPAAAPGPGPVPAAPGPAAHARRSGGAAGAGAGPRPRTRPYLAATPWCSSNDPVFAGLVRRLNPPRGATRWQLAQQVTDFVYDWIRDKNYTVGFASAQEVARNPVGACSQHGVLAVALLRRLGVPARGVTGWIGLGETMAVHFWVEAEVGGRWIPADPTFDQAPASAYRLKLVTTDLADLGNVGAGAPGTDYLEGMGARGPLARRPARPGGHPHGPGRAGPAGVRRPLDARGRAAEPGLGRGRTRSRRRPRPARPSAAARTAAAGGRQRPPGLVAAPAP